MQERRSQLLEIILITAVILLAAVLRMGWPGLTEFKADEARLIKLSFEMAEFQTFPIRGISSSVGLPNFPINVWLYAIPLFFWKHIYAPTIFTGLLNTIAVALSYWFVRRYWGWQAALVTAVMFAVSPWAVMHSRKIWAQNLLAIFVMGWAISATLCLVERRTKWIIGMLLCAAVAFQIHLAAVSLFPATGLLLLIFWRRIPWKWLLIGSGLALLTAVPFLYYLLTYNGAGLESLSNSAGDVSRSWFSWNAILHTIRLSTGWELHALAGPAAFEDYLASLPPVVMAVVRWLWGGLILAGVLYLGGEVLRRIFPEETAVEEPSTTPPKTTPQGEVALVVLIWLASTIGTFLWFPTPVELHYLLPTYPAQYIAAGVVFVPLAHWFRWRAWVVLAMSGLGQAWVFVVLLIFLGLRATPGGYGTPLEMQLQAADTAQQLLTQVNGREVLIAGTGEDPLLDEFAAVYDVLLRGTPHRFVNLQDSAVFPADAAVVLAHPAPTPLLDVYGEVASEQQLVPLRPGEGTLTIMSLPAAAKPLPQTTFDPPELLSNWVNFVGYDPPNENGLYLFYWQVGTNTSVQFHFFNHVLDAVGQQITQVDKAAFDPLQWQEGDLVVSRFTLLDLEKGLRPLTIRTGMYVYPSLEGVPLLDAAANPYADAVEIEIPFE